jgi:hypothetical protein
MCTESSSRVSKALAVVFCLGMALAPFPAAADDTDIFSGASGGTAGNPNVLIIIDNTSNWSAQSQHWPGGITQGQAELLAMKTVIGNLGGGPTVDAAVNVGLMEFACGVVGIRRLHSLCAATMTSPTRSFQTLMQQIYDNFASPNEKCSSNLDYGDPLLVRPSTSAATQPGSRHRRRRQLAGRCDSLRADRLRQQQLYNGLADAAGYASGSRALTTFAPPLGDESCQEPSFCRQWISDADNCSGWLASEAIPPRYGANYDQQRDRTQDGGYGACSRATLLRRSATPALPEPRSWRTPVDP